MLLVFVGLVMVFSASAVMARERYGSEYAFLSKQLVCGLAGLAAMVVTMRVDYRRYKSPAVVFSLMGFTTLLLISVFFLDRSHNTHRWIHAGGFSFQPSELAKPVLILFLAYFLESRAKTIDDVRNTLLPAAAPVLVCLGLIVLQPDLGTAIACAGISACILYVAGMRMRYFGYAFGAALVPLYFLIFHVSWRRDRILAFLNPYADRQGTGFHIIQSLIAVGTGGVTGTGLMEGKQKLFYLPEPHTDFIFAVTAEELGLVGALVRGQLVCDFLVARDAGFVAHGGFVWSIPGRRHHYDGGAAGVHQYQRCAWADADQRDSAATGVVRRIVIVRDAGVRGRAAEYYEAGGMRNECRFQTVDFRFNIIDFAFQSEI